MMHFCGRATTGRSTRLTRVIVAALLLSSFLVSGSPTTSAKLRREDSASYVLNLQTLHCPWFSVVDDLVSLVQMKNTTGTEMNVYLTVRFGSNEIEDGSYEGTEPITLAPYENKTVNIRQIVTQHRKLFKQANAGGIELLFFGNPTDLIAKTSIVSLKHRQAFDVPFVNPMLPTRKFLVILELFIRAHYLTFFE